MRQMRNNKNIVIDLSEVEAHLNSLSDSKHGAPLSRWTPEMDELLLKYWPVKIKSEVAKVFGLSVNTCLSRYRELIQTKT